MHYVEDGPQEPIDEIEDHHKEMEYVIDAGFIIVFVLLLFYMFVGAAIEKYKVSFGHEASYTVIVGKYQYLFLLLTHCMI